MLFYVFLGLFAFLDGFFQLLPSQNDKLLPNDKVELKHKRWDNPAGDGWYVETGRDGSHVETNGPMVLCGNTNIGLWNQVGMGKNWSEMGVIEIDPDIVVILGRA